ncbi:hypothetical protein CAL13_08860 [Bordetella genomosp. 9]|uniref:DUF3168 domain-containing protein n=1 Tax=Bordetella genomosp. 9 TaxID=1416803 RepID=A0A1W6Z5T9_9BORD|nr:hypothetical protein CAL13_08860 [Bordetella genomosp. 9]
MLPPVFRLLAVPTVSAIVGADPVRIYRHGSAPQDVQKPYITWFSVDAQPYDQLSGPPCGDFDTVQIDCWSMDDEQVEALATAVRDALDAGGIANRLVIDQRETDTKLFRIAIQADFIRSR